MASLYNDNKGLTAIQFVGADGRRKTVRLGRMAGRAAGAVLGHVEELLSAAMSVQAPSRDTSAWVGSLPEALHAKLARAGLVQPRAAKVSTGVVAFADSYIKARTDLKPATLANLKQVRNGLAAHFGKRRELRDVTRGDMGDWHRGLKAKLATATVAMHVKKARQIFADAVARRLIDENPVAGIKAGSMANRSRFAFVTAADIARVIAACPDAEWKLIFGLARYAGLRVPSESNALRWADVDWAAGRMFVRSPKTAHHEGQARREVPIFAELAPLLREAFERADEGAAHVVARHRGENLRTTAEKIVTRAGLEPWGKLFQNLRSSCETELMNRFPVHVACAWVGNSAAIAAKHYLQVTDEHFAQAAGNRAAESAADTAGHDRTNPAPTRENPAFLRGLAGRQYPQGESNKGADSREFSVIQAVALRRALRSLKNKGFASPRPRPRPQIGGRA